MGSDALIVDGVVRGNFSGSARPFSVWEKGERSIGKRPPPFLGRDINCLFSDDVDGGNRGECGGGVK